MSAIDMENASPTYLYVDLAALLLIDWRAASGTRKGFYVGLAAAALLACPCKRLAIAGIHPAEGVAPRIVVPVEGCLDCRTWHPSTIQKTEGASHDRALHVGVPRLPTWISQRKICEDKAGYAALLNNIPCAAHDCGRNAIGL